MFLLGPGLSSGACAISFSEGDIYSIFFWGPASWMGQWTFQPFQPKKLRSCLIRKNWWCFVYALKKINPKQKSGAKAKLCYDVLNDFT